MEKTLTYQGTFRLTKLQDELNVLPALAPVEGERGPEAVFTLSATDTGVVLQVPEQTVDTEIDTVVAAHDPTTPSPAEEQEQAEAGNELTANERLEQQIPVLQAARDAITANPPTIFGSLSNQERVVLRNLIRNEIQLIRSVLDLWDAVE